MISALFLISATLLFACIVVLVLIDRRVARADSWESVDRWLLVGSYASPAALFAFGATISAGLAWWWVP